MEIKKSRTSGFELSTQEYVMLSSLMGRSNHGYAIAKKVAELTEGQIKFSAATLYQNLSRMLDAGLIERDNEKEIAPNERRRFYRVSGYGERVLKEQWKIMTKIGEMIPKPISNNSY